MDIPTQTAITELMDWIEKVDKENKDLKKQISAMDDEINEIRLIAAVEKK